MLLNACSDAEPVSGSLPVYDEFQAPPQWLSSADLQQQAPREIAAFTLRDQNDDAVDNGVLKQRYVVANFFFTQCNNQCPKLTAGMRRVQTAFAADNAVQLLSHSVASGLDNATTLSAFADANGVQAQRWRLLSGDGKTIDKIAHDIYLLPDATAGRDRLVHSELFVLLDNKQRVRGFYNGSLDLEIDNLIQDLSKLRDES